eukprot:10772703-Prorocentrum_lima.AAC.1
MKPLTRHSTTIPGEMSSGVKGPAMKNNGQRNTGEKEIGEKNIVKIGRKMMTANLLSNLSTSPI